ncbi:RNA methyltransferase [Chitinophaga pendula]|uniref:methyltransferase RsmF C-terminal domain-like protein n=1 Tax=Chitinophaga TaxID=79328 RepID=UPI000BAFE5DD|nr:MULTISPECIES: RNA methyltransferase [Chitinophaga]ASZ14286.1 RNA methyltransferase [Chitinophaga sp. MD30]UCJ08067.1 RNA methyltransferase [Chitinophaga pendula]
MAVLPEDFIATLPSLPGMQLASFLEVHAHPGRVTSLRFNPYKTDISNRQRIIAAMEATASPVPWNGLGAYLSQRPSFTLDPYFHAGAYYVQEASSMFTGYALQHTCALSQPLKVLDLCAAPGGKSTLIQSLISADSLLVANEVIRPRAALLADNITRWGAANVVVTNNDPRDFARLPGYFDVMVVDAPCSGSGLFRRDPEAVKEWSPENVMLCSQRQQRILADVLPALREDGTLIYSTCSYSREEDEDIMEWLATHEALENVPLPVPADWNIVTTEVNGMQGYRFYPDKIQGEGFFLSCFRKKQGGHFQPGKQRNALNTIVKKDIEKLQPWIRSAAPLAMVEHQGEVLLWPEVIAPAIALLQQHLYLRKAGVKAGQPGKELIPDHQLAVSLLAAPEIQRISLTLDQALQYLRKEDPQLGSVGKGWALMCYEDMPLGWAKLLPNRMNNYYPKELRILKQ